MYSKELVALLLDPKYKDVISELLIEHSKHVNKTRDAIEKEAQEKGISYKEQFEFIENLHEELWQKNGFSQQ